MSDVNYKLLFEENLDTIIKLLTIASVYDESSVSEKTPYGQHVHEAFVFMKNLALQDGFALENYDNQVLSISHGKGDKRIDIVSHIDVVAGEESDFDIHIDNNKIYGRGTVDMKIPMFLTYLSLKLLKDRYPNINKEIRIVIGTDEERTMNDMKYYISKAGYPDFAFTPDGSFPVGIGEKGAIMWTISGEYEGIIESLNAGSQCNIVSPYASCIINANNVDLVKKYIDENDLDGTVKSEDSKLKIAINGKPAHASLPFLGHSATIDLLKLLSDLYDDELSANLYNTYADYYGEGFAAFVSDDPFECLSINLGILSIDNNKVFGQVDCRYPFACNSLDLTNKLKIASILDVSLDYDDEPTLCREDDPYVKILLDTYRNITDDYSKPIISGGVSYSKVFKHCVSFGPNRTDKVNLAHQKGEYIEIDYCVELFRIYYETIEKLMLV